MFAAWFAAWFASLRLERLLLKGFLGQILIGCLFLVFLESFFHFVCQDAKRRFVVEQYEVVTDLWTESCPSNGVGIE